MFSRIATFFSTTAMVTFGGAYAVLAYGAQQAVENYGWLNPREMVDGLGMAETTPGPLIMVPSSSAFSAPAAIPATCRRCWRTVGDHRGSGRRGAEPRGLVG